MLKLDASELAEEIVALAERSGRTVEQVLGEVERFVSMAQAEDEG